jgi:hypothetical protein
MIDWIIQNKEWLFSGIGISIISLVLMIKNKRTDKLVTVSTNSNLENTIKQNSGDNSINIVGDINIDNIKGTQNNAIADIELSTENIQRQYIDKVIIKEGDYIEIPWSHKPYRITLDNIINEDFQEKYNKEKQDGIELKIDSGGGLLYCGKYGKEAGVNHWKIPLKGTSDEELYSVYSYHIYNGSFSFFRCYASHINKHSREVTLSIYMVSVPYNA